MPLTGPNPVQWPRIRKCLMERDFSPLELTGRTRSHVVDLEVPRCTLHRDAVAALSWHCAPLLRGPASTWCPFPRFATSSVSG